MNKIDEKTKVEVAFDMYEQAFVYLKNSKMHESNKHSVGDSNRVEHDFSEVEKAQLDLLKAKLEMEIASEARDSSESFGEKVFWLNYIMAILTGVIAISAIVSAVVAWNN